MFEYRCLFILKLWFLPVWDEMRQLMFNFSSVLHFQSFSFCSVLKLTCPAGFNKTPPPKKNNKKNQQTNPTLSSCAYHLCNCDIVFVQLLWFAENAKCLTKLYTKLLVNNLYILHFLILIVKLLMHVTHLAVTLTNIHNYIDYIYNFFDMLQLRPSLFNFMV